MDTEATARSIREALEQNHAEIAVALLRTPGVVLNATNLDLGAMELLASGKSNFQGSGLGRIGNVRKGLNEHVNNVLVAPGETFSFNQTLGGSVDTNKGWFMAKIIMNGTELVEGPGGGICQVSTTVFRAALSAGLPIVKRRAHSLYVSYYEEYGLGIDATVFPGQQDFTFVNDTGNYLLVQAYDDGFDAVVNIYGTPDGRQVDLDGPYLYSNAPDGFTVNGKPLRSNEIAWKRSVIYSDGRAETYDLVSRYFQFPRRLLQEYASL